MKSSTHLAARRAKQTGEAGTQKDLFEILGIFALSFFGSSKNFKPKKQPVKLLKPILRLSLRATSFLNDGGEERSRAK